MLLTGGIRDSLLPRGPAFSSLEFSKREQRMSAKTNAPRLDAWHAVSFRRGDRLKIFQSRKLMGPGQGHFRSPLVGEGGRRAAGSRCLAFGL